MAQGVGPEFKLQYCKREREREREREILVLSTLSLGTLALGLSCMMFNNRESTMLKGQQLTDVLVCSHH
jgi:hypothetical protein